MPAKQRLKIKQLYSLPNGFHCDGDGLYLNVNGDARSWVFRYRMEGKERKAGLGSLRFVTLAQARAKVFKMKQEMANGITPLELKRQTTQRIATETGTRYFKNYYQEAIENTKRVKGWTTVRTAMRWYKVIERYALPVIGNMDISVIKRDHILQILMPLWEGDPKTGEPPKVETGGNFNVISMGFLIISFRGVGVERTLLVGKRGLISFCLRTDSIQQSIIRLLIGMKSPRCEDADVGEYHAIQR